MAWPFGRKKTPSVEKKVRPEAPRAAGVDEETLGEIIDWCSEHASLVTVARVNGVPHLRLGTAPAAVPGAPAGAVLKVKRGKLSWVDVYDIELRPHVDALIKDLDKRQKWSFNGVVLSKYPEPPA